MKEDRAEVEWTTIESTHSEYRLYIAVMRDALKVEGVRYPATAIDMQHIADELNCMLPTPKVLDLIWLEAGKSGVQFDPVINYRYPNKGTVIVALMPAEDVSRLVDEKIAEKGDNGGIIASVGKYWVLTNKLMGGKFGKAQACNYGWHSSKAPYAAVTRGLKVWQSIGSMHNNLHIDPSQVVRLMARDAFLYHPNGKMEPIDLYTVASDPELAPLISHEGALRVLRQPGVPEPNL